MQNTAETEYQAFGSRFHPGEGLSLDENGNPVFASPQETFSEEALFCAAKHLAQQSNPTAVQTVLQTPRGEIPLFFSVCAGRVTAVTAPLGRATFLPWEIPILGEKPLMNDPVSISGKTHRITALRFGETPYAVLFRETTEDCEDPKTAQKLAERKIFPQGCDVLFLHTVDDRKLELFCRHRDGSTQPRIRDACAGVAAAVAVGHCLPNTSVSVRAGKEEIRIVCAGDWTLTATGSVLEEQPEWA